MAWMHHSGLSTAPMTSTRLIASHFLPGREHVDFAIFAAPLQSIFETVTSTVCRCARRRATLTIYSALALFEMVRTASVTLSTRHYRGGTFLRLARCGACILKMSLMLPRLALCSGISKRPTHPKPSWNTTPRSKRCGTERGNFAKSGSREKRIRAVHEGTGPDTTTASFGYGLWPLSLTICHNLFSQR